MAMSVKGKGDILLLAVLQAVCGVRQRIAPLACSLRAVCRQRSIHA